MPIGFRYPGKLGLAVPPMQDPVAQPRDRKKYKYEEEDPAEGSISKPWVDFFTTFSNQLTATPYNIQVVFLSAGTQNDSIPTTDMGAGVVLNDGLYEIKYQTRITNPAGVSSSLEVEFSWTDSGVPQSFTGAAITGNTTTDWQSDSFLIFADGNTPVNYSTTYASNGPNEMTYQLFIFLNLVYA